jgi:hypothetical protein
MKEVIVTKSFINKYVGNSINSQQLRILGMNWPPQKGWKEKVVGKNISAQEAEIFMNSKKTKLKKTKQKDENLKEWIALYYKFKKLNNDILESVIQEVNEMYEYEQKNIRTTD